MLQFRCVFGWQDFGRYFVNSLVVAGGFVIFSVVIAFLAATAVPRFRFPFRTTSPTLFPGFGRGGGNFLFADTGAG